MANHFIRRVFLCIFIVLVTTIFTLSAEGTYCTASGGCDEYIYGVEVGDIYNSGTPCSGYANYTASHSTTMEVGLSYPIDIVTAIPGYGPGYGYTGDQCAIWIDWNQDEDFYDPNELVYHASGVGLFSTFIIPPLDAQPGPTRMRIRLQYTGSISPCGSTSYGEVEDYTINVYSTISQTRIYGKKWHDLNDNGQIDPNEPGLSGWTIFLDEDHDGEVDPNDIVTTTDVQGNYEFRGMTPDMYYYVSEVDRSGWINTYPGAGGMHYRIMVTENNDVELNFGNYQLHNCNIKGYKFYDANNNGVWDSGEVPLSGWVIYIDKNENGQWDSGEPKTTTNAAGYYGFSNLPSGYYNIMEVPQNGWFQTYPGLTSGRLWGLEGRGGENSTIAELDPNSMIIEKRFAAPFQSINIGLGCLAAGPSTLFYCPLRLTGFNTGDNLFYELDCETGQVINQGILEMPEGEFALRCTWHKGVLYVLSVVPPLSSDTFFLNRYDPFSMELLSRDSLAEVGYDGFASDPYEDLLLCNQVVSPSILYEINPDTANVVNTIGQQLVIGTSMAYTNGVLYKAYFNSSRDDMYILHREDGSLITTQTISDYVGFDAIAGGIGVKGGHRVWIGKKDVEANFGNRPDSNCVISGTKYEDINGNGSREASEPGFADWRIYVDLDGDLAFDSQEPSTFTDGNGDWSISGLKYGRYFVREIPQKGYVCTEPGLGWIDFLGVSQPRDIVFDEVRNVLYISTSAGMIERFALGTNQFLSPIPVGGAPHGMDITSDSSALYVTDTLLSGGNGVVHKINLNTLNVTNLTYSVGYSEDSSYDIAIGSEGLALVTGSYSGSSWVPLYVLDTSTDTITIRPEVLGQSTINDDVRLVRSHDRNVIWLINSSSNGWIGVYDAPSDAFVAEKEYNTYLYASPIALNHNGSKAAIQFTAHFQIIDSDFNMIMGFTDSRIGAEFDPSFDLFYQFSLDGSTLSAFDTTTWQLCDRTGAGIMTEAYEIFTQGETAITADGRVLGITDPGTVTLHRREYYALALPGRTMSGLDFGNKSLLCGDIDRDRDVDLLDLVSLAEEWLLEGFIYDSDVAGVNGPDGYVNLLDYSCLARNWGMDENIIEYDDDFETGDFGNLPWEHAGDGPWEIDSSIRFEGLYSAKSANLPRYDHSILRVSHECGEGNIYFMLRNGGGGRFEFLVDGDLMFNWDSENWENLEWSLVTIPVSAGIHTFEWDYEPVGFGLNCAWIDAIRFPSVNN